MPNWNKLVVLEKNKKICQNHLHFVKTCIKCIRKKPKKNSQKKGAYQ